VNGREVPILFERTTENSLPEQGCLVSTRSSGYIRQSSSSNSDVLKIPALLTLFYFL